MGDIGVSKDALRAVIPLLGEFVGTTDTQTITTKTVNTTDNTLTATSQAAGDILVNNATKFVRLARGSAGQPLKVNSGGTDIEYGTLTVAGGGTGATTLTGILKGAGTGNITAVTAPSGALVGDTDTQNLSGKTFLNQGFKRRNPANTFTLTDIHPILLADSNHYGNQGFTYYVFKVGSSFFVSNGQLGNATHTAATSSSAKTTIQWAIDNVPAEGGTILLAPNTTFDLGSAAADGLTITQSGTKRVSLLGSGPTTLIQYTGTGWAISNTGSSSSLQRFTIGNFALDCVTKTSGRSGIKDSSIAPFGIFEHLYMRNMDIALEIIDTNSRILNDIRIGTANTGILTMDGATSVPNAVWIQNSYITSCTTVGIHIAAPTPSESNTVTTTIRNCVIDFCATGIQLSGSTTHTTLDDIYFEGQTVNDIYIKGVSAAFPAQNIALKNCRASGVIGTLANMIKIDYVSGLLVENCRAKSYTNAMIYLNIDNLPNMTIVNPKLESTPYLIDSVAMSNSRTLGTVVEGNRVGFIAILNQASMIEGDVVVISSINRWIKAAVADNSVPAIVMYGNGLTADRPGVLCMKGITKVKVDSATSIGDTLTTSATSGSAKVNNSAVDPKIIIGHCTHNIGSAGLAYAKIL